MNIEVEQEFEGTLPFSFKLMFYIIMGKPIKFSMKHNPEIKFKQLDAKI